MADAGWRQSISQNRTKEEKVDQTFFSNAFLGTGKEQNEQVLPEQT